MADTSSATRNGTSPVRQHEYALPPRWLIWVLTCLPALIGIGLFWLYACYFSNGFSVKQEAWGQFGDFVGGVLNPIISWMTFVAVAVSLRYTVSALQVSATAAKIAYSQLEHEVTTYSDRKIQETDAQNKERTFQLYQLWVSPRCC